MTTQILISDSADSERIRKMLHSSVDYKQNDIKAHTKQKKLRKCSTHLQHRESEENLTNKIKCQLKGEATNGKENSSNER